MPTRPRPSTPVSPAELGGLLRITRLMPILLLLLSVGLYAGALGGDFLFDTTRYMDQLDAADSPWETVQWLRPMSRPLPQATMALNHAIEGDEPRGYRLLNVLVHAATAVGLYMLTRRLALAWSRRKRGVAIDDGSNEGGNEAGDDVVGVGLAAAVSLLWVAHPLGTSAVTYVIQRHESLMAMGFVWALWGVAASATSRGAAGRWGWGAAAVVAAFGAVMSKQVAVGLPIVAYLMDRCVLSGTWAGPVRRRWGVHLGLVAASAWLILGGGDPLTVGEEETTGLGAGGAGGAVTYLLSQGEVLLSYLRLVVVPYPLVFDWGEGWPAAYPDRPATWVVSSLVVLALLGVGVVGVMRNRVWGWLAFSAFVILGPTSSVMPITDYYFEHRMYLPLACLVALGCLGVRALLDRVAAAPARSAIGTGVVVVLTAALGLATLVRNAEYESSETIWRTVTQRAEVNPRGWYNLGLALERRAEQTPDPAERAGVYAEAERVYRRSLQYRPNHGPTLNNYGKLLADRNALDEALRVLEAAVEVGPNTARHHYNLGEVSRRAGRLDAAYQGFRAAVELDPDYAAALNSLALLTLDRGDVAAALDLFRRAHAADPALPEATRNLAKTLVDLGRWSAAADMLRRADANRSPDQPFDATTELLHARLLAAAPDDAVRNPRAALAILTRLRDAGHPEDPRLLEHIALALAAVGDYDSAVNALDEALRKARQAGLPKPVLDELAARRQRFADRQPYRLSPVLSAD